jgi:DNA polymerase III delta subunit
MCDNDYSRILLEIDKIKRYSQELTNDQAFEKLVEEGAIYQPPKDAIFAFVDAVLKRQVKKVYELLAQCYAIGEANMVILSVLFSNTKQVLQVQTCRSQDIVKSTGLTAWQVKCAKDKCGNYTNGELVNIIRLIQKVQKGIITGQIEDNLAVEYLLVNIL